MRAALLLFLFLPLAARLQADEPDRVRTETELTAIRSAQSKVYLYSLKPQKGPDDDKNQAGTFHGYPILAQAEITSNDEKQGLTTALSKAVRSDDDGPVPRCFDPRHGLRIVSPTSITLDLVICYECGQVDVYGNGGRLSSFRIGGLPTVFDQALQAHHLPKAPAPDR